jgi:dTDP-4-amino-4,6-dideoxygalactose transaminase
VQRALGKQLSGYIGGIHNAGYWVDRLSIEWTNTFKCKYAIPCNSATSGLLACCMAANIGPGDEVWVSSYTMSASAACAKVLGASVKFIDIDLVRYAFDCPRIDTIHRPPDNINMYEWPPKAIIVTNLFGHPAYLTQLRKTCDEHGMVMIEDNAQSPFATENGKYAGTIGHYGVFSFNVHKHIQSGEGGVVTTNDAESAERVRNAVNHGELNPKNPSIGLNLRMTEPIAAIASAQLGKAHDIIETRRALAEELTDAANQSAYLIPPVESKGCKHVYYIWACRVLNGKRAAFVAFLSKHCFPAHEGYSIPLHRLFKTNDKCPLTEKMEDKELVTFEICMWRPNVGEVQKMKRIIKIAGESL